ncbi:MAG: carbohydrate kinase family protein [Candidatus Gracilibacteria bacterium]|nr:carbohydrate kinase family protein [Candidatus Gracilibacteria bacterium]
MAKKFDVCTLGSVVLDTFLEPSEMELLSLRHRPEMMLFPVGGKILTKTLARHVGGSSANAAIGFAKLGLTIAALGTIGDDDHGEFIQHKLQQAGVETEHLKIKKRQPSSSSQIFVTPDGRRTVFHERTAHSAYHQFPRCRALYVGHLTTGEEDAFEKIVAHKMSSRWNKQLLLGWNPGKTQFEKGFEKFRMLFPHIDVLILNTEEAEAFAEKKARQITPQKSGAEILKWQNSLPDHIADLRPIAERFLDAGVGALCVTDGKNGAQYFAECPGAPEKVCHLFAPTISEKKPVSTLGAGDSFSVGLLAARLKGKSPAEQLLWGSLNSNAVIQEFGAQEGQLSLRTMQHAAKMAEKQWKRH